jgi:CheY-like chemotaxis protein
MAPLRILLIDDDAAVLEVVGLMVESEGHHVVSASRAEDALARLTAGERFDVVLTDLTMPGLSGWDLARAVRARWPRVRVGLITGTPEQLPPSATPVDIVLSKPVTMQALRDALARLGG